MRQVLFFLFVSSSAFSSSLSLREIFEVSQQKVESLSQQKAQIELSKAQLSQVVSNYYPTAGFLFSYTRQQNPTLTSSTGATSAFTNPDQLLSKFTLGYTGLQGFREIAAYRSAKSTIEAQEATFKLARVNLYTQVSQAYYSALSSRKDLKNLEELLKLSQIRLTEVRKFVSLGRSRTADLLAQETQVATFQAQVKTAQETQKQYEDALRILTGLEPEDYIADDFVELPRRLESIEEILKRTEERPDIKALKAGACAAEQNVNVAFGGHLPTLGLFADYYPYRTGVLQPVHWDLGLSVNIPLFQGFGVIAQVNQTKATARSLKYALLQAERDAQRQIRSNYDAVNNVIETLPLLKKALELARKTYEQQQLDYSRKLNTNLDVNMALTQYSTLMRTYDQTIYQGKTALEALNASIGQLP
ncbi:MAG: TolC family protein [Myxococcaceae bacterium]